ncbi:hypothetical protein JCGZ_02849 [Jatropha curcas]|uniref:Terpene synthase n=1 Tax=Jatropha curcas TaxID=180498 RepID=A0A067JSW6_JATCU|nr:hypothetical protein JCGZ_02849 [Jatropha curcas]
MNNKEPKWSLKAQISHPPNERRSANYQPTTWSYSFLQSLKNDNADLLYKDKARKLEEEVRSVINDESKEFLTILELIDDIQRLGLEYLFKKDINKVLDRFQALGGCKVMSNKSLHVVALSFRLLRQHGYQVSQDEFRNFMDKDGNLEERFKKDEKGILSLYEASFFSFEGEFLLDNAMTQTRTHLNNLIKNNSDISHALELPLRRRMVLSEARWYIEAYGKREEVNPLLLELAKLNFSMVQSVLQRDLKEMSRWWNNLELAKHLRFSRDRLMECFFSTVGMAFEPQFSRCRKALTKVASFITTIDDVYDIYGTLDELELFTEAVERWDVNALKDLPYYMKLSFLALYNTVNEMAYDTLKDNGEIIIPHLAKAWGDLCKAFLQEAKWAHNKSTPSFEEYIENGWRSVSGIDELIRGETVNSISCYIHEYGVLEEEAREHINKLTEKAWKKINECEIGETQFPKPFIDATINLARISQCIYQYGDSHGAPDSRSKRRVLSLIVEPISLSQN